MENVVSSKMISILSLYDMQSDFFKRAIDGISDIDAHNRLNTKANHVAWLAGELVQQRIELAAELGIHKKQQAHDLFKDNQGIQENTTYPSLKVYQTDWEGITPLLREALTEVSDEELDRPIQMGPEMTFPLYELITFTSYREANMIGQIALYRRLLGYPAMNYM